MFCVTWKAPSGRCKPVFCRFGVPDSVLGRSRRRRRRSPVFVQLNPNLTKVEEDRRLHISPSATSKELDMPTTTSYNQTGKAVHCTLLQLPPHIQDLKLSGLKTEKGVTKGFVLLSKDGRFNSVSFVQSDKWKEADSESGMMKLTREEEKRVASFKKTPFYQMMFRLCDHSVKWSAFWKEASVVPCRIWDGGKWEIAWDVMELWTSKEQRHSFQRLGNALQRLSKGEDLEKDVIQSMQKIHSCAEQEFPSVPPESDTEEGFQQFLQHCVLFIQNNQFPAVSLELKRTTAKTIRISCNRVNAQLTDFKVLSRELQHPSRIKALAEGCTLLPVSSSWLLAFIAVQGLLPDVVQLINAERLKRTLGLGEEVPVDAFAKDLQRESPKNKKASATGTALLRLVTLLNRWQHSENTVLHNSKAESNNSAGEIRNIVLGELIMKRPAVSEVLLEWASFDQNTTSKICDGQKINWNNALNMDKLEQEMDPEELQFLNPEVDIGRNFKAMLAGCFEASGMSCVWELCERIGLVKLRQGSPLVDIVRNWREPSEEGWGIQEWEKYHIDRYMAILYQAYEELCQSIGYEFQEKFRFDLAMHHPSHTMQRPALYGWLTLFGKAFLDLFLQEYMTRAQPTVSQEYINGVFDDKKKGEICFNVAFELKLHEISLTGMGPIVHYLAEHYRDREALMNDNASKNYMMTAMFALIAAIAMDAGMDVKRLMKILEKPLTEEIESCTDKLGATFCIVDRCIPSKLELIKFDQSDLTECTYHSALIQLIRNDADAKVFFSFYVLTKEKLPQFPDCQILHEMESVEFTKRMHVFNEVVELEANRHMMLLDFQSEWFTAILPSDMEFVTNGDQKKKYLVAPAAGETVSANSIDWSLVRSIVKKTIPTDITHIRRHFASDPSSEDAGLKKAAESVLAADEAYSFRKDKRKTEALETSALHKLLFQTRQREVVRVSEGTDFCGDVLNDQCMMDVLPETLQALSVNRNIVFNPSSCRCLPFTFSYFKCLAVVPYLLDLLERKLLAEDYRQEYNLPTSISISKLLPALTSAPVFPPLKFNRLEALGHGVMQFMYTLQVVTDYPNEAVGKLSIKRTELMNSRSMSRKRDEQFIVGHLLGTYFLPYKETLWWYPPAYSPFTYRSVDAGNLPVEDQKESLDESSETAPPLMIEAVEGRVGSGMLQNISKGVPQKHFKAITALCFLHSGIESAQDYLLRIGSIHMSSYPSGQDGHPEERRLTKYDALQEHLQYRFKSMATLTTAFMHSSVFQEDGKNNEKLEFIGDAVLDLCVWKYIHYEFPDISVAQATNLKMDLTRNSLFCWLAASPPLELHKLLMQSIDGFLEAVEDMKQSQSMDSIDASFIKVASDAFEALFGAVFIDSGYSLDTASRVMLRVMEVVLSDFSKFGIDDPRSL